MCLSQGRIVGRTVGGFGLLHLVALAGRILAVGKDPSALQRRMIPRQQWPPAGQQAWRGCGRSSSRWVREQERKCGAAAHRRHLLPSFRLSEYLSWPGVKKICHRLCPGGQLSARWNRSRGRCDGDGRKTDCKFTRIPNQEMLTPRIPSFRPPCGDVSKLHAQPRLVVAFRAYMLP